MLVRILNPISEDNGKIIDVSINPLKDGWPAAVYLDKTGKLNHLIDGEFETLNITSANVISTGDLK